MQTPRLRTALMYAIIGTALLWWCNGALGAVLPRPDHDPPPIPTDTDDATAYLSRVIRCQVRQQAAGSYRHRAPLHYRDDQIARYAAGLWRAVQGATWPRLRVRTTPEVRATTGKRWAWHRVRHADAALLLAAIVRQQSWWVPDAVSHWNRCPKTGQRIQVDPRIAWRRPDHRLDYGLVQMHWSTVRRWIPDATIHDLRDPETNLAIGARWAASRAGTCAEYLSGKIPRCGCSARRLRQGKWWSIRRSCPAPEAQSISCRCLALWRTTGVPVYTGTKSSWSLAGTYVPDTRECFDSITNPDDGDIAVVGSTPRS